MRRTFFPLELETKPDVPLFVRIFDAVRRDILRGRLRPGQPLPGSRSLAQSLGVHRSTVVSAYAELLAQGWIGARPGAGTYISASPPEGAPRRRSAPRAGIARDPGYLVEASPVSAPPVPNLPRGALALWGGVPDLRLVPVDLLGRAYRRVLKRHGHALLGYTREAAGHPALRAAVAELVSSARALAADAESVLITRGSQMALDLVARSLIRPGDVVAVESLCYASAVNVFRRAGATLVPLPIDGEGLDVSALSALLRRTPVRAVYVTPHHQYPTTVMLSPTRRLALVELARRERFAIVEDDYDQEFHYDGRPPSPLASNDAGGNVIYVGTLAKILAPGLRLGFVVAPRGLLERMTQERILVDRQGDSVLECAIAELLEDGDVQRHVRRTRRIYHQRRDALCQIVDSELAQVLAYTRPAGGLSLWATADPRVDLEAWQRRGLERGVYFQIGTQFSLDGSPVQAIRLGHALMDEKEQIVAVRRMAAALPVRFSASRPPRPSRA